MCMSKLLQESDRSNLKNTPKDDSVNMAKSLFGLMADTTWRMFIPTIGFTLFGVWLDTKLSTKPWLMLVFIIIGFLFAGLLVYRQYKMARKE